MVPSKLDLPQEAFPLGRFYFVCDAFQMVRQGFDEACVQPVSELVDDHVVGIPALKQYGMGVLFTMQKGWQFFQKQFGIKQFLQNCISIPNARNWRKSATWEAALKHL